MLDDLALSSGEEKARDLIGRIESKKIEQALPAEMELAIVWGISQLGPSEVEPAWYGLSSLPDVFSEHLVPGFETIVDVAALSDAELPADKGMRNASRKLSHEANSVRRGFGRHLSYYFLEETVSSGRDSLRRVKVPVDLVLTPALKSDFRAWLLAPNRTEGDKLNLREGELDVVVTWHEHGHLGGTFQTSMPPEIRRLRENYLYGALRRKAKQLKNPHFDGLRCVILGDVGSTALRRADEIDYTRRVYNGSDIINEFLRSRECGLDVVAIVTPRTARQRLDSLERSTQWRLFVHCRAGIDIDSRGLETLISLLPAPRLEGYQARRLHEQGVFSPSRRGRYMGTNVRWTKGEKTQIRFSARALLDTLAGRETPERLMRMLSGSGSNLFQAHLDRGETISAMWLEPGGPDEDDDQIVVEFRDDAGARPLRLTPFAGGDGSDTDGADGSRAAGDATTN